MSEAGDAELVGLLELARRHLGMDVAFLAHQDDELNHFDLVVADDPAAVDRLQGVSLPLRQTYCGNLAAGLIDPLVPDTAEDALLATLEVTAEQRIGAFAGAVVTDAHGTVLGTLCTFSHGPRDDLDRSHLHLLRFLADVVGQRVGRLRTRGAELAAAQQRVRGLMEAGEPRMAAQPIVDLTSMDVVGFEALARFSDGGPEEVFAEATAAGLGLELELCAVRTAGCLDRRLAPGLPISINVGIDALMSASLDDVLEPLDPGRFRLELTEHTSAVDRAALASRFAQLRERGFRLALDDVGAGYQGLERILSLRPDVIKLDRELVTGVGTDAARAALVASTVAFAAEIEVELVAEGIETDAEVERLRGLGVRYGQGYVLGRPEPVGTPGG